MDNAPTFDEVYARWYPRAVAEARRRGLRDAEAAAQEVMTTLFKNDYLSIFDPAKASLDHWMGVIVRRWMITFYGREQTRKSIVQMVELPDNAAEILAVDMSGSYGGLKDLVRGVHQGLTEGAPHLVPVWEAVVKQFIKGEMDRGYRISYRELGEDLAVDRKEVPGLMRELRAWLRREGTEADLVDWAFAAA